MGGQGGSAGQLNGMTYQVDSGMTEITGNIGAGGAAGGAGDPTTSGGVGGDGGAFFYFYS